MRIVDLNGGAFAVIDDEDYADISRFSWNFNSSGYAFRNVPGTGERVLMHRQILGILTRPDLVGDHINHCRIDNRKNNLRACLKRQNDLNRGLSSVNTSGFKGVVWSRRLCKWVAQIGVYTPGAKRNRKTHHLGVFDNPAAAHLAYCAAALKLHGEFANFGNGCVLIGRM